MQRMLMALVLVLMAQVGWAQTAPLKNPRAWQFDCPDPSDFNAAESVVIDFFACDVHGANCAADPTQTSAQIPVTSFTQVTPPTTPPTCEIAVSSVPFPVGQVYISKMRAFNAAGGFGGPSNVTDPFGKPGTPPVVAHLKVAK